MVEYLTKQEGEGCAKTRGKGFHQPPKQTQVFTEINQLMDDYADEGDDEDGSEGDDSGDDGGDDANDSQMSIEVQKYSPF